MMQRRNEMALLSPRRSARSITLLVSLHRRLSVIQAPTSCRMEKWWFFWKQPLISKSPENSPPPRNWTSTFWCWVWKSYSWKQPPPPPPQEIELLLFDAESENHIPENSPPPQKLNFYFLMLSPKIIFLKTAPPPEIELLLFDAES